MCSVNTQSVLFSYTCYSRNTCILTTLASLLHGIFNDARPAECCFKNSRWKLFLNLGQNSQTEASTNTCNPCIAVTSTYSLRTVHKPVLVWRLHFLASCSLALLSLWSSESCTFAQRRDVVPSIRACRSAAELLLLWNGDRQTFPLPPLFSTLRSSSKVSSRHSENNGHGHSEMNGTEPDTNRARNTSNARYPHPEFNIRHLSPSSSTKSISLHAVRMTGRGRALEASVARSRSSASAKAARLTWIFECTHV